MNALSYYLHLSQFLLSVKPEIPLMVGSDQEAQAMAGAIDRLYSLVQIQIREIQDDSTGY